MTTPLLWLIGVAVVVAVYRVLDRAWDYQFGARRLERYVCVGDVWQSPQDTALLVFVLAVHASDGFPRCEAALPTTWECQGIRWYPEGRGYPDAGWYLVLPKLKVQLQHRGWRLLMRGDVRTVRGRRYL